MLISSVPPDEAALEELLSRPTPALVEVPELPCLMIDGSGDPITAAGYPPAVQSLYSTAYGVRFALKRPRSGADLGRRTGVGRQWCRGSVPWSAKEEFPECAENLQCALHELPS